jgi:hypothetical protein
MDSRAKISASGLFRIEGDRHSLFVVVVYQEHFDVEKKSLSTELLPPSVCIQMKIIHVNQIHNANNQPK